MTDNIITAEPTYGLSTARVTRSKAHRQRYAYLEAVANGEVNAQDVISAACTPRGTYLGRIKLTRLLATQPGWGDKNATAAVRRIIAVIYGSHPSVQPKDLDISWLVDPRAGGRRLTAWASCVGDINATWSGFPYAPMPEGVR